MSEQQGKGRITWSDPYSKAHTAIQALKSVLPGLSPSLSSSETPAFALLHDADVSSHISSLLRRPDSGAVNDNLCAWLYDTFHSAQHDLHLVVLRFLPTLAGVYLSRAAALNKPLAGFESVLLAIYAHETAARNGQALTVSIPDLTHPSIYHHDATKPPKSSSAAATELHLGVISPSLDPHGTVRSTRRARIVGVALELYYTKISEIPVSSKIEFCQFCKTWSGQDTEESKKEGKLGGRINLPWELLQPMLRILGHCVMASGKKEDMFKKALAACRCLHARALHDINAKAILATGSLLKLAEMKISGEIDYTDIDMGNVTTV